MNTTSHMENRIFPFCGTVPVGNHPVRRLCLQLAFTGLIFEALKARNAPFSAFPASEIIVRGNLR